jgi:hypothetical protein
MSPNAKRWLGALALAVALAMSAPQAEADVPTSGQSAVPPPPVTEREALAAAGADPKVIAARDAHPDLKPTAALVDGDWQVDYFTGDNDVVQVKVDDVTGAVLESWTGYQVAWKMARGYPGAFGHKLNAPYVWLPLCAIFLIGLVDWRRLWRVANLDLLVLLSFGASQFFFNRGNVGLSVPLQYPPLIYLMARMLWVGFRGRGDGLRPVWPSAWLVIAALFLLGFRGGLNVADSGAIDVGYAGVVGADKIVDGDQLYGKGEFPDDVGFGDTYGPVNYYAYVPFEQAFPWSGSWDDLPAAHAAAIFFDLATFALLFLLGRRLRPGPEGNRLGAVLGFAWAAYPYAAFTLESNSNDSLVALLLVATMLALARPALRGAALALTGLTKFAPFILAPLFATYRNEEDSATGPVVLRFVLGFVITGAIVMAQTLLDPGIGTFWDRTIASQIDRDSPFSVWGQVPALGPLRIAVMVALGALAVLVAFRPRHKSPAQLAALAAALLIGTELIAQHWFYLYLVWFCPLVFAALGALSPEPAPAPALSTAQDHWLPPQSQPPSPTHPLPPSRSEPASA